MRTTGKPDVVEVQAFARLVRLGQTPTLMRLQARSKRRRLTRTGCSGSGKSGVRLCPSWLAQSDLGNAVVAFVQSCWSEQGQGPTWGQVASRLGWAKPCAGAVVQGLVQAGRLEVGNEAASMRPGPAVRHSGGEERPT